MAQRMVHYLFGELICDRLERLDRERFLTGSLLPDAVEAAQKEKTHFKIKTDTQVCFDFEKFGYMFSDLILRDDLYLGYYLHLVEDAFYRAYLYGNRFALPATREEVALLHEDYRILNGYVVKKYGLRNCLNDDISLDNEPLCKIAAFRLREFADDMACDFSEHCNGKTHFLTENMLDEFVETYVPLAVEEIVHLKKGKSLLRAADYAWPRKI